MHSSTRNLRRAFSGPAGLRQTRRALSGRPGFVGPAGLRRARHFAARTPKARLFRPGRARAGSDRLLHESETHTRQAKKQFSWHFTVSGVRKCAKLNFEFLTVFQYFHSFYEHGSNTLLNTFSPIRTFETPISLKRLDIEFLWNFNSPPYIIYAQVRIIYSMKLIRAPLFKPPFLPLYF